mmetsp:Transcript_38587/g.46678  ORF Transcript_38587/g.46678 Transcript_38587/m.46678 type:complete len:202 (-) Transcript_38587:145-750(-)|eukprot:CAMPEP_0197854602 /NCGR_PEP_ID=MMETSP1438-20131217/24968_1 /TAXON_ID=1461541 /ORGANISM="Pterosperma sp., Strain CCMP1384" /LENGTH=201 /DNA_ID=CAMNT_0043469391 /DNA_START=123 /DNA_END=728 /DNA_ORIENTATION=+
MPPKAPGKPRILENEEGHRVEVDTISKGNGKTFPAFRDICSCDYVGYLKDGKKFDSNLGRGPFRFACGYGNVIPGMDMAVRTMSQGERALITISPEAGYGAVAQEDIPANSTLIFDLTLKNVEKPVSKTGQMVKDFFKQLAAVMVMYAFIGVYLYMNRKPRVQAGGEEAIVAGTETLEEEPTSMFSSDYDDWETMQYNEEL